MAHMVKNLPAMQETWVWSLGWEDLLEEGMATLSNIFGWQKGLAGSWCCRVRHDWAAKHRAQRFINDRTAALVSASFGILAPSLSLMWAHGMGSGFLPASVGPQAAFRGFSSSQHHLTLGWAPTLGNWAWAQNLLSFSLQNSWERIFFFFRKNFSVIYAGEPLIKDAGILHKIFS